MGLLKNSASSLSVELDPTNYPEFCNHALDFEATHSILAQPRRYPGYPTVSLGEPSKRIWRFLSQSLQARSSSRELKPDLLSRKQLSTVLFWAHGSMRPSGAGPTPSSGGLQALELYFVSFADSWLKPAAYHYSRRDHTLEQVGSEFSREHWLLLVPSLDHVQGGSLLWILVGDGAKLGEKYGFRTNKLLLLEAGHLMQNLCLISTAFNACTVPLGGFFESKIIAELSLESSDQILYTGIFGRRR